VFEYSQFDFTKFYLRFAHTMSRKRLAALLIALAVLSEPAAAELRGTPEGAPVFTAVEIAVITRNAVLSALIQDNPWAVRRVLDALAAISTTRIMGASAPSGARRLPMPQSIRSPIPISTNFSACRPKPCSTCSVERGATRLGRSQAADARKACFALIFLSLLRSQLGYS
jgi:hypothetical protein